MLIITRKPDETVVIEMPNGTLVTVKVIGLSRGRVKLGIDGPHYVHIKRGEICEDEL